MNLKDIKRLQSPAKIKIVKHFKLIGLFTNWLIH